MSTPSSLRFGVLLGSSLLLSVLSTPSSALAADTPVRAYAKKIYRRLTGVPVSADAAILDRIEAKLNAGDYDGGAKLILSDKHFYSVRLRNFAAPYSNKAENPQEAFNDLQALIIGITRDNLDARNILTGNFRYQGYRDLGLPAVSRANNDHYLQFDSQNYDYWKDLTRVSPQWPDVAEAAGALTTRTWAKAHYMAGTNRRSVQYTLLEFMCAPIDQWKDHGMPDHFIRRDVTRIPEGNPSIFENKCRNCHAPMDGMGGAFSRFDYTNETLTYMGTNGIAAKYNQNGNVYPEGYVTFSDNWVNYATQHHNEAFGWRGALEGVGIHAFAEMIANSKGFSQCMVRKVFKEVCSVSLAQDDALVAKLADQFESDGYKLAHLFVRSALEETCVQHP